LAHAIPIAHVADRILGADLLRCQNNCRKRNQGGSKYGRNDYGLFMGGGWGWRVHGRVAQGLLMGLSVQNAASARIRPKLRILPPLLDFV
jgi:hypothetical protein